MIRTFALTFSILALAASSPVALAQESSREENEAPRELSPFEREFAGAIYGTGHAGSYYAGGIGARLRWELLEFLGVEVYLEGTLVDWEGGGFRHDYPNGFNLFIPIRAGDFRFKPFVGFCDILSFVEPSQADAPRADDVLFGAHAGVGGEVALGSYFSMFADVQANFYAGHDRTSGNWTGGVAEELTFFWNVQLNVGVQAHVGER